MKLYLINLIFTFRANKKKDEERKLDLSDYIDKFSNWWESRDAAKPECFSRGSTGRIQLRNLLHRAHTLRCPSEIMSPTTQGLLMLDPVMWSAHDNCATM